ncbi:unnamed protein product [Hermetia illucens]|uniref:Ell-associated factor Eaf n=2 Tax=Hermetia illucens TaxID=343691 RepID=A0A7R8UW77_HERIL|nr:unnamed protein product [Hermetia illucens]
MERSSIGPEIRELKLGKTFSPQNNKTSFHTLKYDFKPASVDLSKVANVDVSANNQVTVTVPNLESSGVPHTVFKGNQRKYTKEFVLIYDKQTNTMTLEKLNNNILVKKTRTEPPPNKNLVTAPPPKPLENSTQRTSSKTRVSTGARKNTIIGFTPRVIQGSPSTGTHKSPQSAPAWNANNAQSTLPSIPMIELDDDVDRGAIPGGSMPNVLGNSNSMDYHQPMPSAPQHHQQHHMQQQQPQYHHANNSIPSHNNYSGSNGSMMMQTSSAGPNLHAAASRLEEEIGELSTSDSSSDSESSGSGSDSDDSDNEPPIPNKINPQQQQQQPSFNGSALILHNDLQLSESNSSDSDSDQ